MQIQAKSWAVCLLPSRIWYQNLNNVTLPSPCKPPHSHVPLDDLCNPHGEEESPITGGLLLWEIWTESICLPSLFYPFITSPVWNTFHIKCFTNMYEIRKLIKYHFVESKPDFLLYSPICRCWITVTLLQCKENGFLVWVAGVVLAWMDMGALHVGQSSVLGWRPLLTRPCKEARGGNALNARPRLLGIHLKPKEKAHWSLLSCKASFLESQVKSMHIWMKKQPTLMTCSGKKVFISGAYITCAATLFYQNLVFLSSKFADFTVTEGNNSVMPSCWALDFPFSHNEVLQQIKILNRL